MVEWKVATKLMEAFPGSFINRRGEFIAAFRENEYICLEPCTTEHDVQCRVLEWLSRGACKTAPWCTDKANNKFHTRMREGINRFLGTQFSHEEMCEIYDRLGNGVNHALTIRFIESGYDMQMLRRVVE